MNVSKMRTDVGSEKKKVVQVLRQNGEKKESLYDFRKYLIKDGAITNDCILIREELTATTTAVQNRGYTVPYYQMMSNGELVYDKEGGYLKVIMSQLNVGNDTYGTVVPNLFIVPYDALQTPNKYAKYKLHVEGKYYADEINSSSTRSKIILQGLSNLAWEADPDADFCEKVSLMDRKVIVPFYNKVLSGATIELTGPGSQRSVKFDGSEKFLIKNAYFIE